MSIPPSAPVDGTYYKLCGLQEAEKNKADFLRGDLALALLRNTVTPKPDEVEQEKKLSEADIQRRYGSLCKKQLQHIAIISETKSKYSEVLAQLLDAGQNNKKKRQYLCHLCGQPKKGHVCTNLKKEDTQQTPKVQKFRDSDDDDEVLEYDSSDEEAFSVVTRSGRKTKRSVRNSDVYKNRKQRKRTGASNEDGDEDGEEEEEEAEEEEEEEDQGIEEELYDDSADDQVSDSGGDDFAEYYINAPPLKSSSSTKSRKKRTKVFDAAKNREVKVVVIGAGMAGITAARKLRDMEFNVTVLEARSRIGGRIYTESIEYNGKKCAVDLGALFIHGTSGNPLTGLCSQLGVTLVPYGSECKLYDYDGTPVASVADSHMETSFNKMLEATHAMRVQAPPLATLSDALNKVLEDMHTGLRVGVEKLDSVPQNVLSPRVIPPPLPPIVNTNGLPYDPTLAGRAPMPYVSPQLYTFPPLMPTLVPPQQLPPQHQHPHMQMQMQQHPQLQHQQYQQMQQYTQLQPPQMPRAEPTATEFTQFEKRILNWHIANIEGPCGASVDKLDLLQWDQDDPYEFAGDHCLIREGCGYMVELMAQNLEIKYNHVVKKVEYGTQGVRVITDQGDVIEADAAVVTLPLGILKSGEVEFSPALPSTKTTAIQSLGFGLLNKVVLSFPTVFWDMKVDHIGCVSDKRGWLYQFINLEKCVGAPVLVALFAGHSAHAMEKCTDEYLVESTLTFLRKIYPSAPNPTTSFVTRWEQEQFSRGSYSFVAPGANGDDYAKLAAPVHDSNNSPRLFFAGEATMKFHPSTITGAFMSGVREAINIAKTVVKK